MDKKRLPPEITEILKNGHFAYFCTTDKKNQPHVTPMFFIFDGETKDIFVVTFLESKKMKNIHVNPKVSLTVDVRDPQNPFNNRGVMVQGEAMVEKPVNSLLSVKDKKLLKVYKAFRKKYPILDEAQAPTSIEYQEFSETLVRIVADKMVYWRGPHFITVNFNRRHLTGCDGSRLRGRKMFEPKWSPGILFLSRHAWVLDSPLTRPFRRLLMGSKVEIFRWAGIKKGMEVLELGPGPGYFTLDLARQVKTGTVHAVDLQEEMISKLRRKLERKDVTNVRTYVADAAQLPLENDSIDLVFAYSVLEEVQDLAGVVQEIHRVLRPRGVLAIVQVKWDFTQDQKRAMKTIVPAAGFDMIEEIETFLTWKARYEKVYSTRKAV